MKPRRSSRKSRTSPKKSRRAQRRTKSPKARRSSRKSPKARRFSRKSPKARGSRRSRTQKLKAPPSPSYAPPKPITIKVMKDPSLRRGKKVILVDGIYRVSQLYNKIRDFYDKDITIYHYERCCETEPKRFDSSTKLTTFDIEDVMDYEDANKSLTVYVKAKK